MGLSSARARRDRSGRAAAVIVQGILIWVCGVTAVALAAAFIALLAVQGWNGLKATSSAPAGFDLTGSLVASAYILGIALPLAVIPSFLAAAAGTDVEIGGPTSRWLEGSLRAGPMAPTIAFGAAALWFGIRGGRLPAFSSESFVVAAIALAAFNLPGLTARIMTALRAVPDRWRTAAIAVGAAPHRAFLDVTLPRALPSIAAAIVGAASKMFGETAIVATVLSRSGASLSPVSFDLWRRLTSAPPGALPSTAAATETLLLVTVIVALRYAARLLHASQKRGADA
jgi:phosphate transport system permease protein